MTEDRQLAQEDAIADHILQLEEDFTTVYNQPQKKRGYYSRRAREKAALKKLHSND